MRRRRSEKARPGGASPGVNRKPETKAKTDHLAVWFCDACLLPFSMAHGISHGMTLRIDKSGRIAVTKPLRERLGLKPHMELEAVEQPGGVLLRPVEQRPSMVKVDGLWVHQGVAQPGAAWDRVLDDMREE